MSKSNARSARNKAAVEHPGLGVMGFVWGAASMCRISVVMVVYNWQLAITVLGVAPVLFAVSVFFRKHILRIDDVMDGAGRPDG